MFAVQSHKYFGVAVDIATYICNINRIEIFFLIDFPLFDERNFRVLKSFKASISIHSL